MTRVAALDCGTNSLRLLIADVDGDVLTDVVRRMEIVRLGEGVDRTGRLSDAALARTFGVLDSYADAIAACGVDRVRMVATSATRDAENRSEFVAGVRERIGVDPDVVTGDVEAGLSFDGATRELRGTGLSSPYLVVDIGGGSTEFALGDDEGLRSSRSEDIGCVRLTERYLHDDPPTADQVAAATAHVEADIDDAASVVAIDRATSLIGLAGSVTTVVALASGLTRYDPALIHHRTVSAQQVTEVTQDLITATREQRAEMPVMHPGRVDVIGGGALVLDTIMRRCGFDAVVASEHDILDGIAFSIGD